jgi:hypothetical protein
MERHFSKNFETRETTLPRYSPPCTGIIPSDSNVTQNFGGNVPSKKSLLTPKLRPLGPRPSPRAPDGQDPAHQHGIRPSLSQNLHEEKIGDHIICPRLPSGHCPPGYRARPRHVGAPPPRPYGPAPQFGVGWQFDWSPVQFWTTIPRSYLARLLTDSPSCNPFQV